MNSSQSSSRYNLKTLDKILIIIALVGTLLIGTADYLLWFNLSADTKVSSIILWLTAIVIIKYTIETYDLRVTTEREVKIQEEIMMNAFLPVIAPFHGMIQNTLLHIDIRNAGQGLAKNVEIKLNSTPVVKGLSILGGSKMEADFPADEIGKISGNQKNKEVSMEISYQDIYNRKFKTTKNIFYRDQSKPDNHFQLKQGGWRFQKYE